MNTTALPGRALRLPGLLLGLGVAASVVAAAIAIAVAFGGPRSIQPMSSINQPFAQVDFRMMPEVKRFPAREGTTLAWRQYLPAVGAPASHPPRRIVLVHGSSASSRSLHPLAQALAAAGFTVNALDMRGHGDSGPRGQAAYVGQLEDDLEDFMRATPFAGPSTLLGFSSGGGFVLRVAGGARQDSFDRYVLLSPYLRFDAPTSRPDAGWASVGVPRIIGLRLLNHFGATTWNDLPVVEFALNDQVRRLLTPRYSYTLAASFGPHDDYRADIRGARHQVLLLAGTEDELFHADLFAAAFAEAGRPVSVTLVPGVNHIGLTLAPQALAAIVRACGV